MDNNNPNPKYHYIQCVGDWEEVKRYVNNEGYEIWQMCAVDTPDGQKLVYLLRKERRQETKEI